MNRSKVIFINLILFLFLFFIGDLIISNYFLKLKSFTCYKFEEKYYELRKNCEATDKFKSSFPTVKIFTDKLGLRSYKNSTKDKKKDNVLIFGDSFTFGVGIEYEETFSGLLEKEYQNYNFYNYAVGSYSPTVHFYKLEKAIQENIIPSKIILFLDLTDVYDEGTRWLLTKNSSKPYLSDKHIIKEDSDEMRLERGESEFTDRNFKLSKTLATTLNYNFRILRNKLSMLKKAEEYKIKTSFQGEFTYVEKEKLKTEYWTKKIFDDGIKKIEKKIDQISKLSKDKNFNFYLVIYPWGETLAYGQDSFSWENFGKKLCSNQRCILINTFDDFNNKKEKDRFWYSNLYFIGDEHFNPSGNKFMFNILSKKIFN